MSSRLLSFLTVLILCVCATAQAEYTIRGGGAKKPRDMGRYISGQLDAGEFILFANWTPDGGWVVVTDEGWGWGGKLPGDMVRHIKQQVIDGAVPQAIRWQTDGSWVVITNRGSRVSNIPQGLLNEFRRAEEAQTGVIDAFWLNDG